MARKDASTVIFAYVIGTLFFNVVSLFSAVVLLMLTDDENRGKFILSVVAHLILVVCGIVVLIAL